MLKVPIPLVVLIILIAIYLVVAPVISNPNIGFLIAAVVILSSLVFYYPFVYRKIELKPIRKSMLIFQNLIIQTFFRTNQCIPHASLPAGKIRC